MCAVKINPKFQNGKLLYVGMAQELRHWETTFPTCVNVNQMCEIFQNYLNLLILR